MIHLEGEIVGSVFDLKTRTHSYIIERGGKRWTVKIPEAELTPKNKIQRRNHLASALENAMRGPADGE